MMVMIMMMKNLWVIRKTRIKIKCLNIPTVCPKIVVILTYSSGSNLFIYQNARENSLKFT